MTDAKILLADCFKIGILVSIVVGSFVLNSIEWPRPLQVSQANQIAVAACILAGMYILMIFELVNRTLAALIGAGAALAAHQCLVRQVDMAEILQWEDLETLALLFGMMIIVGVLGASGLFDFLAIWSYKQASGRFWLLITIMAIITGLLSAFIDNVSTMLLMAPTLIRLSELEHIDPRFVLMIMVIFCNLGGCATPVGDPPNLIIIGDPLVGSAGISFGAFVAYCGPGVLLAMLAALIYLKLVYKSKESFRLLEWKAAAAAAAATTTCPNLSSQVVVTQTINNRGVEESQAQQGLQIPHQERAVRKGSFLSEAEIERLMRVHSIKSWPILIQSLSVLTVAVLLFFVQSSIAGGGNMTLGWISLFAGLTLLVLSSTVKLHASPEEEDDQMDEEDNFERVIKEIEWSTLMFFFGLFIVMEVMEKLSLISFMGDQITNLIELIPQTAGLQSVGAITIILWSSGLASACIDNVPFTSMMIKILGSMLADGPAATAANHLQVKPLVFALAFGACFGGNGSLIGASANLVTAGVASRHNYPITFAGFFKFAAPITLITLLVANIYLVVVFVLLGL